MALYRKLLLPTLGLGERDLYCRLVRFFLFSLFCFVNTLILRLVRVLIRKGQDKKFPLKAVNGLPFSVPKAWCKPQRRDRGEQTGA